MISVAHPSDESFVPDHGAAARTAEAERAREDQEFRQRMRLNLVAAVALIALTLFGVWLANAMVASEKTHGCYVSGEHTCSLI
jgi:hypothetical protein